MAKTNPIQPGKQGGAAAGASLGLSCGFLFWALAFPWSSTAFHYPGEGDAPSFIIWSLQALTQWFVTGMAGAAAGAVLGGLLGARPWLLRVCVASSGLYLFAARGAWGNLQLPETNPPPLPWTALLIPAVMAILAGISFGIFFRNERKKTGERLSTTGLLGWHILASCSAMHLATQLPYYLSRASAFFRGLQGFTDIF